VGVTTRTGESMSNEGYSGIVKTVSDMSSSLQVKTLLGDLFMESERLVKSDTEEFNCIRSR